MSYAAKVRRGVELLDREMPGWHERINTETLLIEDREKCVFGQLYGDYWAGVEAHEETLSGDYFGYPDPNRFGFDGSHDDSSFAILNRLWLYAVKVRQARHG